MKVMILLMVALVLSASGCFNDEMSSPEGTVKGYYRALNQYEFVKSNSYVDPREVRKEDIQGTSRLARVMTKALWKLEINIKIMDLKTTLVSEKEILVWKGNKWGRVKNENATVEVSYKLNGENIQQTVELVLMDNKWYIISWR